MGFKYYLCHLLFCDFEQVDLHILAYKINDNENNFLVLWGINKIINLKDAWHAVRNLRTFYKMLAFLQLLLSSFLFPTSVLFSSLFQNFLYSIHQWLSWIELNIEISSCVISAHLHGPHHLLSQISAPSLSNHSSNGKPLDHLSSTDTNISIWTSCFLLFPSHS